jgi:EAL domain-containing protein (putative c-di-GMP-specific phosphodiesterase class I)
MSSSFLRYLSDPQRARNVQDGLFTVLVMGVAVALMLFLLGSADILTSLSIIGILLCLSLVGSVMRFFSMTRLDTDLREAQSSLDASLKTIQSRVGDHDLALLQMAGQIETIESDINTIKKTQILQTQSHQAFMGTMKNKMMQLIQALARTRNTADDTAREKPRTKKSTPKNFFTPPLTTANDEPASPPHGAGRYDDDDVFISPALIRDAVDTAIKNNRIDTYVQPISTLPQRHVHGYDVMGRVRFTPGVYIPARQYRGQAAHAGQQVTLDRMVLSGIPQLAKSLAAQKIFVNICDDALRDAHTIRLITDMMARDVTLKNKLVLEFSERDFMRIDDQSARVITALQQTGVAFGVNDVKSADFDLNKLARLKFTYLKLAYDRLVTTKNSDAGAAILHRFITRLQTRNVHLIVACVETPAQVRAMMDFPIALAQGFAFGRPDRPVAYQPKTKVA